MVARRFINRQFGINEDDDKALVYCYETGHAVWNQLSDQERQKYLGEFSNLSIEDAQAILGYELMNKYGFASMRYCDFRRAASDTQFLFKQAARAGWSETEVSKTFEYIKSISQNKDLTIIATTATISEDANRQGR